MEETYLTPPEKETEAEKQTRFLDGVFSEGRKYFSSFELQNELTDFYLSLLNYFHDEKGVLLMGKIGTGKSTCLKICKKLFGLGEIINCNYVAREYIINGESILDKYGRNLGKDENYYLNGKKKEYIFDDLGMNDFEKKRFGNSINPLAEIIYDRYELFQWDKIKTHFATNLDIADIKTIYGDRIADRLKEMCNIVIMPGKSLRK